MSLRGHFHGGRPHPQSSARNVDSESEAHGGAARRYETAHDERYRLISVDAVRAPEGCAGGDWFVYRIAQASNGITGYRRGSLERVSEDVETIVSALNERREWRKNRPSSKNPRHVAAARRDVAK